MKQPELSVVAPVFNERECLPEFYKRLTEAVRRTGLEAELIFINDGSSDDSAAIVRGWRASDPRVKLLDFSRNFGHQIAIKAGVDCARGEAVIIIDTDLQDPPEVIADFVAKWKEGYDVVYAVRAERAGESLFKKWTASLYYRLIRRISGLDIPLDAGDFRLVSRSVADAIRSVREKNPYMRGLVAWVGFRQTGIPIKREGRFAGSTKYPLRKMLKLAWNGITHFSNFPLKLAMYMGFAVSLICLAWILQALYVGFILKITVPGWTSLMVAVLFIGGVQLITLGILGSYLWRNYDESRGRPLYIVRQSEGFDAS